jgi:galactosamine-6-phosphate isomerase
MKFPSTSSGLKVDVSENPEILARRAAGVILTELKRKPDLLLCVSAGGTPAPTYRRLAEAAQRTPRLFSRLRILQVDEWGGLPPKNPATCESDLRSRVLLPLKVTRDRYVGFKSNAANPKAECARVSRWLGAHGPIDICILGLGLNGHVAMNEPASELTPRVHVARLARSSQKHPLLKDLPRKPQFGLTLGMADILHSRKILLLVSGSHKREPLERLLRSRVTSRIPASFLWLHPDAHILCDRDSTSSL